ncbi:MAG: flippase-like domain-containing protein [Rhodospirillales bacterium]|nr:flippase-like domain-containing protein [Rhodospirillales bacterium]
MRLSIGVLIVACLVAYVPLDEVVASLRAVAWKWLLAACALALCAEWLASIQLRILADAHRLQLSTLQVFEMNLATRLYGLIMPGGTLATMAVRIYRLSGKHGHYAGGALAATADRLVATLNLCVVGCIFWLLALPRDGLLWLALNLATLTAMAVVVAALLARRPWPLKQLLLRMGDRFLGARFATVRRAVWESRAMPGRRFSAIFALSIAQHLLGIATFYLLALALGLPLDLIEIGWIRSAMVLASLLPVSLLGLGPREGAALLALQTYGISAHASVAFSLSVFAVCVLFLGLLGGAVEFRRHLVAH